MSKHLEDPRRSAAHVAFIEDIEAYIEQLGRPTECMEGQTHHLNALRSTLAIYSAGPTSMAPIFTPCVCGVHTLVFYPNSTSYETIESDRNGDQSTLF